MVLEQWSLTYYFADILGGFIIGIKSKAMYCHCMKFNQLMFIFFFVSSFVLWIKVGFGPLKACWKFIKKISIWEEEKVFASCHWSWDQEWFIAWVKLSDLPKVRYFLILPKHKNMSLSHDLMILIYHSMICVLNPELHQEKHSHKDSTDLRY